MTDLVLEKLTLPTSGSRIEVRNEGLHVPDDPIVVLIEGDGIGRTIGSVPGITDAATRTLDAAVDAAYSGKRRIEWFRAHAGDAAREVYHRELTDDQLKAQPAEKQRRVYIPDDTLNVIKYFGVALKGPLTTPIGEGFRSINVFLRQHFDLYACVRPVKYFNGVPAPNRNADKVDIVVFRENTEDVYAGIEFEAGSPEGVTLRSLLESHLGAKLNPLWRYGFGLKPMSEEGSKRLIRRAIQYALDNRYKTVTLMHKGNIMKFTEGAFRKWGYELAKQEFAGQVVLEEEVTGAVPEGVVILNHRIADSMFQQIQLRPGDYGVIATPNLNGDYISDAAAAMVGGLGLAPGANIGDSCAVFEATHGTAPKYAGKDMANPGSLMLSGAMLLDHLGWREAGDLVREGIARTIAESAGISRGGPGQKLYVTYDLARQFAGYTEKDGAPSSEFADRVIYHMTTR